MNTDKSNTPLVTVCIATYNRETFLPITIESVVNQTYREVEIIIVDDCSGDGTPTIVRRFMEKDKRIKYVRHRDNKGLAAVRNAAVFRGAGKYFTFVDDDDRWERTFIEKFVKEAEEYDDKWCFCCGRKYKDGSGETRQVILDLEGKLVDIIRKGFVPPPSSQFYLLTSVKDVGGYNERIKSGVDHDLWLKLGFAGHYVKSLPDSLSIINADTRVKRMTTEFEVRTQGIDASLNIWKGDILDHMGYDFYNMFKMSYEYTVCKEFIIKYLKEKEINRALALCRRCPAKRRLFQDAVEMCLNRTTKNRQKAVIGKPLFFEA